VLNRSRGDGVGCSLIAQPIHVTRLADVPVLAKLAGEITASGAERKNARAGIEMIQRLFLNGIDAKAG
jgi:hypothetical protein